MPVNDDDKTAGWSSVLERARSTEGFFPEFEADLLMRHVRAAGAAPMMLEVGSYFGRSSLFMLAAAGAEARLICVDNFSVAAAYRRHSWESLIANLAHPEIDGRVQILPMTLAQARPHLAGHAFDISFVDADHSFLGAAQDLALTVALSRFGGTIVCHDVCDLFPGVEVATEALSRAGVLAPIERTGSIVAFRVIARPSWLVDPAVFRDADISH